MDKDYYQKDKFYLVNGEPEMLFNLHDCKRIKKDHGCLGCPGKLKFRTVKKYYCGFSVDQKGSPIFKFVPKREVFSDLHEFFNSLHSSNKKIYSKPILRKSMLIVNHLGRKANKYNLMQHYVRRFGLKRWKR